MNVGVKNVKRKKYTPPQNASEHKTNDRRWSVMFWALRKMRKMKITNIGETQWSVFQAICSNIKFNKMTL